MTPTITRAENLTSAGARVVTGAANTSTTVFADQSNNAREIAYRILQNCGTDKVYYNLGETPVDIANNIWNGYLNIGDQLNVSGHTLVVTVASPAALVIGTTLLYRNNLGSNQ